MVGRYVIVHVAVIQLRQETLYSYTTHTREGKDADGCMLKGSWREEKLESNRRERLPARLWI